ncbi:single-stranded-DNA-specific exonuclease [Sporobacter termitidis DSM 10068]|uniref:Single-stranded-DNA-specific exonuclease RecJ n=1 Tax=Sporobacter termitidis DSM 10068 TaxID=1123282 RepID=A0A1M5Z4F1_9FIRM|nr:single-stranded-DNA-specific exonuclease RecJ [Sporobacter termitidis]SHI19100.1 single-stranded-DNA-specific exonuclease [Sporobacter termitidis DSM 10068]
MKFVDWVVKGYDRAAAVKLSRSGINPLVSVFLAARGMTTVDAAREFLREDLSLIADPFLLKDMDAAVERIRAAIRNGERIAVYGDYDVDGMTASCLLACYFRAQGADFEIYIPGRMDEGYGVNNCALEALAARGVSLVVTVDCGITALEEALYAKELGIDLIITDHHECKETLPDALAVVDPKRRDCPYPNKSLAGVGVAFKLVCALERGRDIESLLLQYGDFVAIGTIADVMSVVGENRILIRRGLHALNKKSRPGLRRLMRETCVERRDITTPTIGFVLAPRLNAAGRMGRTSLTVDLLLTESEEEAEQLTLELCSLNNERRELESGIFEEAYTALLEKPPKGPVVLESRGWYQGVMGIVAARIAEQFLFPAVMISVGDDGVGRGSCRSFGSFKMYSALEKCSDLLENFGGHEMAAGLTITEDKIGQFRERIFSYYHETIKIPAVPTLRLDFEVIKPELLTLENVTALERIEPFGNSFLPPFLCMRGAVLNNVIPVGGGKHTKLRILKAGKSFDCICFGRCAEDLGASEGDVVDVAFEPQVNEYRGWRNVQLHIIDIRAHSESF